MYGAESTYPVAALLLLAALVVFGAHLVVRRVLQSPRYRRLLPAAAIAATVGLLLVGRALIGMLRPVVAATETPGVTPLALAVGAPLIVYAGWVARRVVLRDAGKKSWWGSEAAVRSGRVLTLTAFGVLLIGLLWAANSFAGAYGRGRAADESRYLSRRPEVVLFTEDPLPAVPARGYPTPIWARTRSSATSTAACACSYSQTTGSSWSPPNGPGPQARWSFPTTTRSACCSCPAVSVRASEIRDFADSDGPQVSPITRDVVRHTTYPSDPAMIEDEAHGVDCLDDLLRW